MFNIGFGELVVVLVLAFVVVGPDDLPKVARWLGRQVRSLRTLMREIKRETGWDELEHEVNDVHRDVKNTVRELDVTHPVKQAVQQAKGEVDSIVGEVRADANRLTKSIRQEANALDGDLRAAAANIGEEEK